MKNILVALLSILLCSFILVNCAYAQSKGQFVQLENSFCKVYSPNHKKNFIYVIDSCNCKKGLFSGNATLKVYQQDITSDFSSWDSSTSFDTTTTLNYELTGDFKNGYLEGEGTYSQSKMEDDFPHTFELTGIFKHGEFPSEGEYSCAYIYMEDTAIYVGGLIDTLPYGKGKLTQEGYITEGFFGNGGLYNGASYIAPSDTIEYFWKGEHSFLKPEGFNEYPIKNEEYTAYYDRYFEPCEKENAVYYWSGIYTLPHIGDETINLFYCENKALAATLKVRFVDYQNVKESFFDGKQVVYYPNGQLRQEVIATKDYIVDSLRVYNENGDIIARTRKISNDNMILIKADSASFYYYFLNENQLEKTSFIKKNDSSFIHIPFMPNKDVDFIKDYISIIPLDHCEFFEETNREKSECGGGKNNDDIPFIVEFNEEVAEANFSFTTYYTKENANKKDRCGWSFNDYDSYYAFLLQNNNISFNKYDFEGKLVRKYFSTNCHSICADTNAFKVVRENDIYSFYLNDHLLYTNDYISDYIWNNELLSVHSTNDDYRMIDCDVVITPTTDDDNEMSMANLNSILDNISIYCDTVVEDSQFFNATGTGFFIHEDGYILTAQHVIDQSEKIIIETDLITGKMKDYAAEVVLVDKPNDIALLKIKDNNFHISQNIPYIFDTTELDLGEVVFALGYPKIERMGKSIKYTEGVINSIKGYNDENNSYQISATVQPGSSGCPIYNVNGSIIGLASAAITDRSKLENINYCIKAKYITNLIKNLQEDFHLPNNNEVNNLSRTQRIKLLSKYVVLIKTT